MEIALKAGMPDLRFSLDREGVAAEMRRGHPEHAAVRGIYCGC